VNQKARAYLQLVRPPNLFTAAADVVAGFLFIGGGWQQIDRVILLSLCSMCLYAAGVTLNDARDVERDRVDRPERPIPSGRVTPPAALHLIFWLFVAGLVCAAMISSRQVAVAVALVAAILLYNSPLKATPVAPAVMGLCRALNLTLGMTALDNPITVVHLLPIAVMWLYITAVTAFARTEARPSNRGRLAAATVGASLAVASLAGLCAILPTPSWHFLLPVAALTATIALIGARAARTGTPRDVQRAVTAMIVLLIAFDACIATAGRGLIAGVIVAVFFIPVWWLGRRFRAT
jgi:4-hydroxybenzoate polyprenyltransferase